MNKETIRERGNILLTIICLFRGFCLLLIPLFKEGNIQAEIPAFFSISPAAINMFHERWFRAFESDHAMGKYLLLVQGLSLVAWMAILLLFPFILRSKSAAKTLVMVVTFATCLDLVFCGIWSALKETDWVAMISSGLILVLCIALMMINVQPKKERLETDLQIDEQP